MVRKTTGTAGAQFCRIAMYPNLRPIQTIPDSGASVWLKENVQLLNPEVLFRRTFPDKEWFRLLPTGRKNLALLRRGHLRFRRLQECCSRNCWQCNGCRFN